MKILLSDLHIAPFKKEKFLTQKKNFIEWVIQFFAGILKNKEINLYEKMSEIVREENISLGINNGDLMEAVATERGWETSRDSEAAKKVYSELSIRLNVRLESNLGNHETGYDLPLCTDREKGIRLKSIVNFLEVVGRSDVYHSFVEGSLRFIFVPYFFSEEKAKDFDLSVMKEEFLQKMERDILSSGEPIMLFVHDPDSFVDKNLLKLVRDNRTKIEATFYGHYHSRVNLFLAKVMIKIFNVWILYPARIILNLIFWIISGRNVQMVKELGKYFRSRKSIPDIIKELKMVLIPAPMGMFGIGGGFLTLEIFGDGSYKIKKHS